MPYYLRPILKPLCEWSMCRANATQQLFNSRNAPCGFYCKRHARDALNAGNDMEFDVTIEC